jgi:hypothetical protein
LLQTRSRVVGHGHCIGQDQQRFGSILHHRPEDRVITHHVRNVDRTRAYAPVDGILAAGRKAGRLGEG